MVLLVSTIFWLGMLFACFKNVLKRKWAILIMDWTHLSTVDLLQRTRASPSRTNGLTTDLAQVAGAAGRIQEMLTTVLAYIEDVLVSVILGNNTFFWWPIYLFWVNFLYHHKGFLHWSNLFIVPRKNNGNTHSLACSHHRNWEWV